MDERANERPSSSAGSTTAPTWRDYRDKQHTAPGQLIAVRGEPETMTDQIQRFQRQQLEDKDEVIRSLQAQRDQTFKELAKTHAKLQEKEHETWLLRGMLGIPLESAKAQVAVSHFPVLEMRWVTIALRAVSSYHPQGTYIVWRPNTSLEVPTEVGFVPLCISLIKPEDQAQEVAAFEATKISHKFFYVVDATAKGPWRAIAGSVVAGEKPWRHIPQDFPDNPSLGDIFASLDEFIKLSPDLDREITTYKFPAAATRPFMKEWLDGQMAVHLATAKKPVVKEIFVENIREKVVRVALPSTHVEEEDFREIGAAKAIGAPSYKPSHGGTSRAASFSRSMPFSPLSSNGRGQEERSEIGAEVQEGEGPDERAGSGVGSRRSSRQ